MLCLLLFFVLDYVVFLFVGTSVIVNTSVYGEGSKMFFFFFFPGGRRQPSWPLAWISKVSSSNLLPQALVFIFQFVDFIQQLAKSLFSWA